jgi:hypothetical protein
MVWEYQCPVADCTYSTRRNEEPQVTGDGQQRMRDSNGGSTTRDDVGQYVLSPG